MCHAHHCRCAGHSHIMHCLVAGLIHWLQAARISSMHRPAPELPFKHCCPAPSPVRAVNASFCATPRRAQSQDGLTLPGSPQDASVCELAEHPYSPQQQIGALQEQPSEMDPKFWKLHEVRGSCRSMALLPAGHPTARPSPSAAHSSAQSMTLSLGSIQCVVPDAGRPHRGSMLSQ